MDIPTLPEPPPPAECTQAAFAAFATELTGLPVGYMAMPEKQQAQVLLSNKAADGTQYRLLRAQAIRCAR